MTNPRLRSKKLVYPALPTHISLKRKIGNPKEWDDVLGNCDFSAIISGRSGCLEENTLIQTINGIKKIKDCPTLFMVKSHNFESDTDEYKLALKINSGKKQTYKITFDDESYVIASKDHIFFTNIGEKKLSELNKLDKLKSESGYKYITKIEPYKHIQTYDLKVADNHNFYLENGLLTHNSGKDTLTGHIMNRDLENKRTVIVLDVKMEYPLSIFCQLDTVLRHILRKVGIVGRGYNVNLWIPYVQGLCENHHFRELLEYKHPNLKIRPFRILKENLISEDTANMAMSKTQIQSMADKTAKLSGTTRILNELREHMAKMKMGFDDENIWEENCGWEYIDFNEMANNKQINVISTFFLTGTNVVAATSFMIGIMNELMTIGKGVHRNRRDDEVFTIVVPELQVIMPKRVKTLEQAVNTLSYSMLVGMLLMRSFYVRLRINLQNLSSINPDMLSQSRIFCGRTTNPKDLVLLNTQGVKRSEWSKVQSLKTGDFIDVINKKKFSCIPYCHKAREKEPLLKCLKLFRKYPSLFLFETQDALYSEIVNFKKIFYDGRPLTVLEYERRMKNWLNSREEQTIKPLPDITTDVMEIDDTLNQLTKKKLMA